MPQKTNYSWKAPEYAFYPKSVRWYLVASLVAIIAVGFALFSKDYFMFVTLAVLLGIGYFLSRRKPKTITITLDERGLAISGVLYPYETVLKKFWIHYHPPMMKTLNFESSNYLNRDITIELEDEDPVEIRKFLLQNLEEDLEKEESYLDKLLRAMKF